MVKLASVIVSAVSLKRISPESLITSSLSLACIVSLIKKLPLVKTKFPVVLDHSNRGLADPSIASHPPAPSEIFIIPAAP